LFIDSNKTYLFIGGLMMKKLTGLIFIFIIVLTTCMLEGDIFKVRENLESNKEHNVPYTVTFNKNNSDADSTEADPQTKTVMSPATTIDSLPEAPTRTGYTFGGWNTQSNGSGSSFTAMTTVTESITVYAQWVLVNSYSYTVTFNKNNTDAGSTDASPQTKTVSSPATTIDSLPVAPTRIGYIFIGWNTEADGSGDSFSAISAVIKDITVYAQWQYVSSNSHTVIFNKNNTDAGSVDANPPVKVVTSPATTIDSLPAPPTRAGYTFTGWNTNENGLGSSFTAITTVTESITVYAQWTGNTYTVTFNKNSGDTEANPQTKTVTVPATTIDNLPTPPTRAEYTFDGWNTQEDGLGTSFTAATTVTASITVYAQWTAQVPSIIEMVRMPTGIFVMGSHTTESGHSDNETQRQVTFPSHFWIGMYQVTQEQWEVVMTGNNNGISTTPSYFHGGEGREPATGEVQGRRPVESVSWYDVIVFCNRLSIQEDLTPA
jgi:uncharacterized repeat protein (TIGR02543 family)